MERREAPRNPGPVLRSRIALRSIRATDSVLSLTHQRPPDRPRQPAQAQESYERQRQAEDPALARARLGAQYVLDEALAAGHLGEALLVGGDAADFVVGERRALVARRPLAGVEPGDFGLEASHVLDRSGVDLAFARGEGLRRADGGRGLDQGRERLVGRGVADEPQARGGG